MSGAVHQVVPSFSPRDAIGGHVLRLQEHLRAAGVDSEILVTVAHPDLRRASTPYRRARLDPDDVLLFHASTSDEVTRWLLEQPNRLILDYHNITEARFFDRWMPEAASSMRLARLQLGSLAPRAAASIAHSRYSADELVALGFRDVEVGPLLFPVAAAPTRPDRPVPRRGARWLFVGRLAPNKCQHRLVAALAAARCTTDPEATLTLVGGRTSARYADAIERLAADLGVAGAVVLRDSVPDDELEAAYRDADVFVSASEHEGFGAPLVEAMARGVPVVAVRSSAVGETVEDAGLLLEDGDPAVIAHAIAALGADPALTAALRAAGLRRAASFRPEVAGPALARRVVQLARRG